MVHEAKDCPCVQSTRPIREGRGRLVHEAKDCPCNQSTRAYQRGEGKISPMKLKIALVFRVLGLSGRGGED